MIKNIFIVFLILIVNTFCANTSFSQDALKSDSEKHLIYDQERKRIEALENEQQYHGDDEMIRSRLNLPPKLKEYDLWVKNFDASVANIPAKKEEKTDLPNVIEQQPASPNAVDISKQEIKPSDTSEQEKNEVSIYTNVAILMAVGFVSVVCVIYSPYLVFRDKLKKRLVRNSLFYMILSAAGTVAAVLLVKISPLGYWLSNHIFLMIAIAIGLCSFVLYAAFKMVESESGLLFVDGTDGIITFGSSFFALIFAGISYYLIESSFPNITFGDCYLVFLAIFGFLIIFRSIVQNSGTFKSVLIAVFAKIVLLAFFVLAIAAAFFIASMTSTPTKQRDNETDAEYLERKRAERKSDAAITATAGAVALGAFAGAAHAVDKLSKFSGIYSLKFSNISRWVSESFMLSNEIVAKRLD